MTARASNGGLLIGTRRMSKLVSAGRTTTLSTNQVRPTAAETALSAFFPPLTHSLFRGHLEARLRLAAIVARA